MTPILETLLPLVTQYAHTKARLWLEGSEELSKPDDDLASFLARHDVEWDQLETAVQDTIRDTYLEAVREAMKRPVQSDSATSSADLCLLLVEARESLVPCFEAFRDYAIWQGVCNDEEMLTGAQNVEAFKIDERVTSAFKIMESTLTKLQSIKA